MQVCVRSDDRSSEVYRQRERDGTVRGRKQMVQGTGRSVEVMEVSHILKMWNIGAGDGQADPIEWSGDLGAPAFWTALWSVSAEQWDGWRTEQARRRRGRTNLGISLPEERLRLRWQSRSPPPRTVAH